MLSQYSTLIATLLLLMVKTFPLNDLKAISVSDFKSRQGFIFYEDWNRFQGHFKRQSISMMISSDNAIRNQFHSILLRAREEETNQTDLARLFSISVKNPPRHWPTVSSIGTGPYGCLGFMFEGLLNQNIWPVLNKSIFSLTNLYDNYSDLIINREWH